jgi:hypothetical protein
MKLTHLVAAASLLALCGCSTATAPPVQSLGIDQPQQVPDQFGPPIKPPPFPVVSVAHETSGYGKLAPVAMAPDTNYLSTEERQVVNLLIQAGGLLNQVYLRQVFAPNPEVRAEIDFVTRPPEKALLLEKFDTFFGPWDPIDEDKPFFGETARPEGAGYYPVDLTKEAFDAYLTAHPDEKTALTSPYTVVQRVGDRLVAVPYSQAYRQWLEPAAKLMEQAAAITTNPSLKRFLILRAQSFRTDDYYESELAWMDLTDTPIEFVIGPYETYEDGLYGQKTAFEAFVTLRNPEESKALGVYKSYLRDMEANLPVESRYKNFKRGFESPISVVDQVGGGGEAINGIPSIAFNLPNDERVREAKGAKKVILRNLIEAKFDKVAGPMAKLVLVPEQAALANRKYMTLNTVFHELSHSLGPGSITVGGKATTVTEALKDQASGLEEAKADMLGLWNILYMEERGVLPANERDQAIASYVVDVFRHVRMGLTDAHARGAAFQYSYLVDQGAIRWDPKAERFRFDGDRFKPSLAAMIGDVIRLQGNGDYVGTKAFMAKWGVIDAPAKQVIGTMTSLPVDIRPSYPEKI